PLKHGVMEALEVESGVIFYGRFGDSGPTDARLFDQQWERDQRFGMNATDGELAVLVLIAALVIAHQLRVGVAVLGEMKLGHFLIDQHVGQRSSEGNDVSKGNAVVEGAH